MATPTPVVFAAVASGAHKLGGRAAVAVPAWVPPAGFFADVPMLNNPQDVMPAMYKTSPTDSYYMDNPFILWGGSAVLRDYSPLGAQAYYSGGHETSYNSMLPNIQMSLICDFSSLLWSVSNLPTAPHAVDNAFDMGLASDGSPYCPHSYLGIQELPKAWGGGPKGSLMSFFWSAATGYWRTGYPLWVNRINLMDVSQASLGYSQLTTNQFENADPTLIRFNPTSQGGIRSGSYPITVMDEDRQGWWASPADDSGSAYMLFVHKSGLITQYAKFVTFSSGSLVVAKSLNLLIGINGGYSAGSGANNEYRTLYIHDLNTGARTTSLTLGTVPGCMTSYNGDPTKSFNRPDELGLQWVDELGCMVGFDDKTVPPTIVKLTPPASNPATAQWTWSVVPVAHWPSDAGGQSNLQAVDRQGTTTVHPTLSKFRWVPTLRAFVFGTDKTRKPQVVKI